MAEQLLSKPQAGEQHKITSNTGVRLEFGFSTADAVMEKMGNDLVFTFSDGSSIVLTDFYTAYSRESLPDFVVEGQTIAGADFFAALSSDLMPAAGPAAKLVASNNRFRSSDDASLFGGIDRLGGLDITAQTAAPQEEAFTLAPAFVPAVGVGLAGLGTTLAPETPVAPPVQPPVEPSVNGLPTVGDSSALTDYGDFSVSGTLDDLNSGLDGYDSITIEGSTASRGEDGNWTFTDPTQGSVGQDGSLSFNTGSGNSVTLDPKTGDYTVSTTKPDGLQDSSLNVTVKDSNGDIAEGTIRVESPTVSTDQAGNTNDVIIKGEGDYNNDIIVSDKGGITTTTTVGGDYNIAIVLDVSGSMSKSSGYDINGDGKVSGDPGPYASDCPDSRLDMAIASIKSLVEGFKDHQGTINLAIFPFATNLEKGSVITLTIKPNDDFDAILKQLTDGLNKITRYPEAGSYDASTYPDKGANAANDWLQKQPANAKDVAFILSDGDPSQRDGSDATNAFKNLQNANPGVVINGIGFGEANLTGKDFLTKWGTTEAVYIKTPSDLTTALEKGVTSEIHTAAGSDYVVGGAGHDIIFGDTAIDYEKLQGQDAVRKYIADKLGMDVDKVSPEIIYTYIKKHPGEFDESHLTGTDSKGNSIDLDKADMLVGGSGHDIIYGQGGDDVLLGDGTKDSAELLSKELGLRFDSSANGLATSITNIASAINKLDHDGLSNLGDWAEKNLENAKTDGNDVLFGGSGNDVLFGGGGDDKLFGGDGNDILFGGSGNDYINGGAGSDQIIAGSGDDIIVYDAADTFIDGGDGFDVLVGGSAADLAAMREGLGNGTITEVELLISGNGSADFAGLTNMDDLLGRLGLSNSNGKVDMSAAGFSQTGDSFTANGIEYVEMSKGDDLTIIIAKSALETSGA